MASAGTDPGRRPFAAALAATLLLSPLVPRPAAAAAAAAAKTGSDLSDEEVHEIAVEAVLYAYPLVLMDVSLRVMTSCASPKGGALCAPINQFAHAPAFPDASFTDVVRPNADTLYSTLWFDVGKEPLVIRVPDSGGRYYLLPMLDLWTDVFAAPGKRTTGTAEQTFALVGPRWQERDRSLPKGVQVIRAPTAMGWIIGRVQTDGKADYPQVHAFQAKLEAVPLHAWGKPYTPPAGRVDATVSSVPPVEQVAKMDAAAFFSRFVELTRENPPHPNDYPILHRMARIGIEPGRPFDLSEEPPRVQKALRAAMADAQAELKGGLAQAGTPVNHWRILQPPVGTYGTDYARRAAIAYGGLGANVVEDAVYPSAFTDGEGRPLDSGRKYVLHFTKQEVPPVRAFWSLTMYDDRQLFAANPIDRYAIGDRDALRFAPDGSLTLYIQRESPGKEKEGNWLPAPKQGGFSMNLRLYWPKPDAIDGVWKPPAVKRLD